MSSELEITIKKLFDIEASGDYEQLENAMCDCIYSAPNFFDAAVMYITLEQSGFHFDFGSYTIPKGTILYRIRAFKEGTDFSDPAEWSPPPRRPQNRANHEGEQALYLSCMEETCLLETQISEGEKYVLGRYEVKEDIITGGYFSPKNNQRLISIGIMLNAILIAPSRNARNNDLFLLLDESFGEVFPNDIQWSDITKNNLWLPFKLAVMNRNENYHIVTNILCDILKTRYSEGIKYSSCYFPIETIGIDSNCYNLVLYEDGMKKLKFLDYETKTNKMKDFTSTNLAKLMLSLKEGN
jgi:hypothetical protein